MALQHLRSNTANKRPDPTAMADGQLAINTPAVSPGLFFKDAAGVLVKVGPVHVGTTAPNASPASGGTAGNSVGEQWLDTTGGTYVFKVWDGSAWRSESGTFVDASGDTMTGALVMDNQQQVRFRETTANGTNYIALQAPASVASDKTITLPDQNGSVLVSGNASIVNADVNASAAIAGTKISPDFGSQTITTTGIVSAALGAAATPSITFTGDTNTGIYSPGADQVAISTGGSGRLFVDASGRILAGTASSSIGGSGSIILQGSAGPGVVRAAFGGTSPGSTDILGAITFADSSHTGAAYIYGSRDGGTWTSTTSQPSAITFGTTPNGSGTAFERLRITSAGLVGVGTSAPVVLFDCAGTGTGVAYFRTTDTGSSNNINIVNGSNYSAGVIGVVNGTGSSGGDVYGLGYSPNVSATDLTPVLTWTSGNRVGIGTTSPDGRLHVLQGTTPNIAQLYVGQGGGSNNYYDANNHYFRDGNLNSVISTTSSTIQLFTNNTERARIDSSGRLLVGTSSARSVVGNSFIQVETGFGYGLSAVNNAPNDSGPVISLGKTRGASPGGTTIVNNADQLGAIFFSGQDGSNFVRGAQITGEVDGTPGANDMPGRLVFSTTADGASSPTERMRIASNGEVLIGTIGTVLGFGGQKFSIVGPSGFQNSANFVAGFNRTTDDGSIIGFYQADALEGTISVSGTTVSYNGAHLSRWSQLLGIDPYNKAVRPEILRGTVMSNLDEMCDWTCPESGECQDNEQLNKTKISDVEGDKNVAGIFQAWDDDDDTWVNDYYLAMTGDFVIRIAAGTTVERGDLLMSAGDGTAKPQADDLVRSCTVAKVTSTTVSCTHPDGSYCVPCVLMAC